MFDIKRFKAAAEERQVFYSSKTGRLLERQAIQ
jgi:hypothetical protein